MAYFGQREVEVGALDASFDLIRARLEGRQDSVLPRSSLRERLRMPTPADALPHARRSSSPSLEPSHPERRNLARPRFEPEGTSFQIDEFHRAYEQLPTEDERHLVQQFAAASLQMQASFQEAQGAFALAGRTPNMKDADEPGQMSHPVRNGILPSRVVNELSKAVADSNVKAFWQCIQEVAGPNRRREYSDKHQHAERAIGSCGSCSESGREASCLSKQLNCTHGVPSAVHAAIASESSTVGQQTKENAQQFLTRMHVAKLQAKQLQQHRQAQEHQQLLQPHPFQRCQTVSTSGQMMTGLDLSFAKAGSEFDRGLQQRKGGVQRARSEMNLSTASTPATQDASIDLSPWFSESLQQTMPTDSLPHMAARNMDSLPYVAANNVDSLQEVPEDSSEHAQGSSSMFANQARFSQHRCVQQQLLPNTALNRFSVQPAQEDRTQASSGFRPDRTPEQIDEASSTFIAANSLEDEHRDQQYDCFESSICQAICNAGFESAFKQLTKEEQRDAMQQLSLGLLTQVQDLFNVHDAPAPACHDVPNVKSMGVPEQSLQPAQGRMSSCTMTNNVDRVSTCKDFKSLQQHILQLVGQSERRGQLNPEASPQAEKMLHSQVVPSAARATLASESCAFGQKAKGGLPQKVAMLQVAYERQQSQAYQQSQAHQELLQPHAYQNYPAARAAPEARTLPELPVAEAQTWPEHHTWYGSEFEQGMQGKGGGCGRVNSEMNLSAASTAMSQVSSMDSLSWFSEKVNTLDSLPFSAVTSVDSLPHVAANTLDSLPDIAEESMEHELGSSSIFAKPTCFSQHAGIQEQSFPNVASNLFPSHSELNMERGKQAPPGLQPYGTPSQTDEATFAPGFQAYGTPVRTDEACRQVQGLGDGSFSTQQRPCFSMPQPSTADAPAMAVNNIAVPSAPPLPLSLLISGPGTH